MKKIGKRLLLVAAAIVVVAAAALLIWANDVYEPSATLTSLVDIDAVTVDKNIVVQPANAKDVGFIFYPGAKVAPAAYAYIAEQLGEAGYTVIIPHMPFHFALLRTNKAATFMEAYPTITRWVVGGHSLGGVAASMFAAKEHVDGLVLFASYPSGNTDLSTQALPVLSLYAEFDGLTQLADIEQAKPLLPTTTEYVQIAGGNHAQFGLYGEQAGDGLATIEPLQQQQDIIEALTTWLEQNNLH